MYQKFSESDLLKSKLLTYVEELPLNEEEIESLFMHVAKGNVKAFSNKLKQARIDKGISQLAMASQLDTRQATFSGWENGLNIPRIATLKRILELYALDPGELLDPNPLSLKNDSNVPELDRQFFFFKSFDDFTHELQKVSSQRVVPVALSDKLSFAFKMEDESMNSGSKAIPKDALVLCSTFELRHLDFSQKEVIVNNKIALVSIAKQDPQLRLIKYENGILSVIPLNKDFKQYSFPDNEECKKQFIKDNSLCLFNGYETYAGAVEIYGIAKKVIFDC